MRRALISDIHGNLEALERVLEDIRTQRVSEIFCLGDIVGYGPNPRECIDRVIETCKICLLGNHDQSASSETDESWTRQQLNAPADPVGNQRRRDFLGRLPRSHRCDSFLFVHGSPRNPLSEYVFPEDIHNHPKMERLFQCVECYCFHGHTHIPGIITEDLQFLTPDEIDLEYALGDGKLMINVGSVGQPRDGDNRAGYVILEDGLGEEIANREVDLRLPIRPANVFFRRVSYDFGITIRKINMLK